MILTAYGSTDDKVDCFSAGADDYVVKPFDARELVARIKALIRRQAGAVSGCLVCGDLEYTPDTRDFRHNNQPLALRHREHTILEALMLRQGKTVSKTTLMESVVSFDDELSADAIDILYSPFAQAPGPVERADRDVAWAWLHFAQQGCGVAGTKSAAHISKCT